MRATLIHNPGAGDASSGRDELVELLEDAGYRVRYQSSKAHDWKAALDKPADLIVAAGGDGTITKVAKAMRGKRIPLAILPLGTANNIATALGIGGTPKKVVASLAKSSPRPFDLWKAAGPWGEEIVVEGCRLGAITESGAALDAVDEKELEPLDRIAIARATLKNRVARLIPFELRAKCDGKVLEGSFLSFEAMNIGFAGPQLPLCDTTKPGDGRLDVVLVRDEQRDDFRQWLAGGVGKSWCARPTRRCERLSVEWSGTRLQLGDGSFWPKQSRGGKRKRDGSPADGRRYRATLTRAGRIKVLVPNG